MKKLFLLISVFLLSLVCVNADDFETVEAIDTYVENNVEYEFHWYAQGVSKTINTMKGDCTDKAMLKCYYARIEGIPCRTVHGYWGEVKHDWSEFKIDGKWITFENKYYDNLVKKGRGVW